MTVAKKLVKVGDAHAMYLDTDLLALAGADVDTVFRVTVEGHRIVLEAITPSTAQAQVIDHATEVIKIHSSVLKKLAED